MKTVSYGQNSALFELFTDGGLDQSVGPGEKKKIYFIKKAANGIKKILKIVTFDNCIIRNGVKEHFAIT